ncbi:hypothetical protein chiPu_0003503 [Chiloscyllium punctatum]|uniref:Uncharacterized protein n=1 Tax=Chiloscyllium punctatum TaxID=137246 RepID=A0A401S3Z6_CHIPU|nr:hypothetical protein [Chiloscyllium punctatum]
MLSRRNNTSTTRCDREQRLTAPPQYHSQHILTAALSAALATPNENTVSSSLTSPPSCCNWQEFRELLREVYLQ